ncbi:glycosyltransferase family 2 protein [Candidatus Woesearchaeota archaeon]|nr:glycosyltransferase family 2 protein [Candidatus Woesearchaeota archaeon]
MKPVKSSAMRQGKTASAQVGSSRLCNPAKAGFAAADAHRLHSAAYEKPFVHIILLNWNNYDLTKDCLESLKKVKYPNFKTIVVDNGSASDVPKLKELKTKGLGFMLIENSKNLGFAEGNNVGIRRALEDKADYILLLNNDTVVHPEFLGHLVSEAEKGKQTSIVSPLIYYYDEPRKVWYAGALFNFWHGDARHQHLNEIDKGQFKEVTNTGYSSGCAMLVRKEVFEKIGLLDPYFFLYYEESDFCIRAKRQGYDIKVVPASRIWHKVSSSIKKGSPLMIRQNVRNRLVFMRKNARWYHWPSFATFYIAELAALVMYKLLKRDGAAAKAAILGFAQGIRYRKSLSGKMQW